MASSSDSAAPTLTGTVIRGFTIGPVLRRDGVFDVYGASNQARPRGIALEVLRSNYAAIGRGRALVAMANRGEALEHNNVAAIVGAGVDEQVGCYVLAAVADDTLDQLLRSSAELTWQDAARLLAQVARGLAFGHAHGLPHGHVGPWNVIVSPDKQLARVSNFGLYQSLQDANGGDTDETCALVGSTEDAAYMAPELADGRPVDALSDQYSLGILLYAALTGSPPFTGKNLAVVLSQHLSAPVPPLPTDLHVPNGLERIVRRTLAKSPQERFSDLTQVADALEGMLPATRGGEIVVADPSVDETADLDRVSVPGLRSNLPPKSVRSLEPFDPSQRAEFRPLTEFPRPRARVLPPDDDVMAGRHDATGAHESPPLAQTMVMDNHEAQAVMRGRHAPRPSTKAPRRGDQAPKPEQRTTYSNAVTLAISLVVSIGSAVGVGLWMTESAAGEMPELPTAAVVSLEPVRRAPIRRAAPKERERVVVPTKPEPKPPPVSSPSESRASTPAPLPESLSEKQIAAGLRPAKDPVAKCGEGSGVSRLPVRFIVDGTTGRVVSALISGGVVSPSVATCARTAVKDKAKFQRTRQKRWTGTHEFVLTP